MSCVDKIYSWALRYQGAISFVLALFAFAFLSVAFASQAHGDEFGGRLEKHQLKFDAKCIRGADSADLWVTALMQDWDEVPVWIGNNGGGRIIITRNSHNPTWSFLIETPDGTCMLSSGDSHFLNDVDGAAQKFPSKSDSGSDDGRSM